MCGFIRKNDINLHLGSLIQSPLDSRELNKLLSFVQKLKGFLCFIPSYGVRVRVVQLCCDINE